MVKEKMTIAYPEQPFLIALGKLEAEKYKTKEEQRKRLMELSDKSLYEPLLQREYGEMVALFEKVTGKKLKDLEKVM